MGLLLTTLLLRKKRFGFFIKRNIGPLMDFGTRNAMSANNFLSTFLFFISLFIMIMETLTVTWVNYFIIFPSLYGSLVSANRPLYVLPPISLCRFLILECPCYFAKFIVTYLSFKRNCVCPSLGNSGWFTRSLVGLVEWSSLCFQLLLIPHLLLSWHLQMLWHATICILFLCLG